MDSIKCQLLSRRVGQPLGLNLRVADPSQSPGVGVLGLLRMFARDIPPASTTGGVS